MTADKSFINTHESRFSKITELIKSKNISFERFLKRRTAKILFFRLLGLSLQNTSITSFGSREAPGERPPGASFCIFD